MRQSRTNLRRQVSLMKHKRNMLDKLMKSSAPDPFGTHVIVSNYYEYIQSDAWFKKSEIAKARAGYRCQVCNKHSDDCRLVAHHRTYERLGCEEPNDITVLCYLCHELYEKNKRIPEPIVA